MKKIILSAAFIAVSFTTFAQVAVGTTSPDASAALDVTSTTQGFLPPRMTRAQMNAIAAPAAGLMVYCSDCTPKGVYVNNDSNDSGSSEFINMITGENTNIDTTTAVVDLISTTGRIWMDRNLGATQAATAYNDAAAAGDMYQWGRAKDGHESRTSSTTTTKAESEDPGHGDFIIGTGLIWTERDPNALWPTGLNDPCPTGYRVPTEAEFQAEIDNFTTNNDDGAFEALKLSLSGFRWSGTGAFLPSLSAGGYYWSSTYGDIGRSLDFDFDIATMNSNHSGSALAIRCIKEFVNESITDTETDVVDLISTTGRIWMDRNLGATQAATGLFDEEAYGDLYQWGRAKDGHEKRDSDTTTTTVTSANAGHGNFIIADATTDNNWTDFAAEDALWPTGLNDPCPSGYRIPTRPEFEAELEGFSSSTEAFDALNLQRGGYRTIDGENIYDRLSGYYWSSSLTTTGLAYMRINYLSSSVKVDRNRGDGLSIRCIKKE